MFEAPIAEVIKLGNAVTTSVVEEEVPVFDPPCI